MNTTIKISLNDIDLDNRNCPICFEEVNIQTECKHNYCEHCLSNHLNNKKNCPLCRQSLKNFYAIVK